MNCCHKKSKPDWVKTRARAVIVCHPAPQLLTTPKPRKLTSDGLNYSMLTRRTSANFQGKSQRKHCWRCFFLRQFNFHRVQMTRLTISFKEMQFITSERNELYGSTDFLANCGGLLGLFTGFSFLSTIEIIYFLTLRLFCNIKKFGRHFWSGSPELLNNDAFEKKVD